MKLIYLCSPYYSPNAEILAANVARAKLLQTMIISDGAIPLYTPFLLTNAGLNDGEHHSLILELCNAYILKCDEVWVYKGVNGFSNGQRSELSFMDTLESKKPIKFLADIDIWQWLEQNTK